MPELNAIVKKTVFIQNQLQSTFNMAWNENFGFLEKIVSLWNKNNSKISHQKPMAKAENPKNSPFAIASILVQMDSIELTRFEVAEYPFEACFLNPTP